MSETPIMPPIISSGWIGYTMPEHLLNPPPEPEPEHKVINQGKFSALVSRPKPECGEPQIIAWLDLPEFLRWHLITGRPKSCSVLADGYTDCVPMPPEHPWIYLFAGEAKELDTGKGVSWLEISGEYQPLHSLNGGEQFYAAHPPKSDVSEAKA